MFNYEIEVSRDNLQAQGFLGIFQIEETAKLFYVFVFAYFNIANDITLSMESLFLSVHISDSVSGAFGSSPPFGRVRENFQIYRSVRKLSRRDLI